jgi:hypothetical protein
MQPGWPDAVLGSDTLVGMVLTGTDLALLSAAFGAVCGKALDLLPFKKSC